MSNDPHDENKRLYAIDVALVGKDEAPNRWQIRFVGNAAFDPACSYKHVISSCLEGNSRAELRRDPNAPPQPSLDWLDAPDWATHRLTNGDGWADMPGRDTNFYALEYEPRPPQDWFDLMRAERESDEPTDDGVLSGAALHRAIADARDDGETPEFFEIKRDGGERWIAGESWTHLIYNDAQGAAIRRKPTTRHLIDANGERHEFPEPMRSAVFGQKFWLVFDGGTYTKKWGRIYGKDERYPQWLAEGRCHATKEARDAHESALIAASGGEVQS